MKLPGPIYALIREHMGPYRDRGLTFQHAPRRDDRFAWVAARKTYYFEIDDE